MRACVFLIGISLVCPPSRAADPEPSVEEVIQRHLEAIGGVERLEALQSLRKTGTYVYNGMEHSLVSYHKAERKCREEIEGLRLWGTAVWEGHTVVRGTNGSVAWAVDESRPEERRRIPAANATLIIAEADLHGALHDHERKGHRVALVGRGDVDGRPAYLLELTLASGIVQTWHLDEESFLVVRKEVIASGAEEGFDGLECPRAWHFDDYRPVGGVMVPFWIYVEEPLFAREYIFEAIEANVSVADGLFEPPPGSFQSEP
jgi:hypothetical protein